MAAKTEGGKRDWAPIIVTAAVGVLGSGIVASLLGGFFSEFGKPNVQVLIIPDKDDQHKVSLEITNPDGKTAATHLKLLIRAPENIIHYSNLSSENMSISQIGPKLLAANMPRLAQGYGSFAIINLTIDAKPKTDYSKSYRAYATYDQESTIGSLTRVGSFITRYGLIITLSVLFGVGYTAYIIYWLKTRKAKRLKKWTSILEGLLIYFRYRMGEVNIENLRRELQYFGQQFDYRRADLVNDHLRGRLNQDGYDKLMKIINDGPLSTLEYSRSRMINEGKCHMSPIEYDDTIKAIDDVTKKTRSFS